MNTYRKIGQMYSHVLIERQEDRAVILSCTSPSKFGGVSITEPALDQFKRLDRSPKFVLLRNTTGGWSELIALADLPEMIASEGSVGADGKPRPKYCLYDQADVPSGAPVDPALLEYVQQLDGRRPVAPSQF